ncbi:aconitase X swivel domain-containing protein [Methylorubrum populi]
MTRLKAHPGIGPEVRGLALVARDDFSARYDLDRVQGVFSRQSHALFGQSYVGRILVLNTAKGGVASAWMLRDMVERGLAPAGLLFNRVNPILAQGAVFANLPLMDRFEGDVTDLIASGDEIVLDPARGIVTILRRVAEGG